MKKLNKVFQFLLLLGVFMGYAACEHEIEVEEFESAAVDFTYKSSSIHYIVGEEIQFINQSVVGSTWEWHFGDGATSTDESPVHKYTTPGTYEVKLLVDGGTYEKTKSLMVSDIIPIVSYTSSDSVIVYNQTEVNFDVIVADPDNLGVNLEWSFPEGTTGDVDENGKSSNESPTVVFSTIGDQNLTLKVTVGEKVLSPVSVIIRSNYDKPVKTFYYAVKGGNIMGRYLISDVPDSINKPFDMGYRSGKHPLTMQFVDDWLYVFDAGTHFGYVSDYENSGNGEIFAVSYDGAKRESVIENFGGNTFLDFYYGYIDEEKNMIYWADRREGIYRTSINTRNQKFSTDQFKYFVRNSWLGYYGQGISWGATNGPIAKIGDTYWWAKNSTGSGIFRFLESDINSEATPETLPAEGVFQVFHGANAVNHQVRGMAIDEMNNQIYIASQTYEMVLCYDMNTGELIRLVDGAGASDGEGGTENLFVTGMAIDQDENGNGYLYWAYRGPVGSETPGQQSGVKRVKLNDPSAEVEYYIEGVEGYGVAVDNTLR